MTAGQDTAKTSARGIKGAGSMHLLLVTIDEQVRPISLRVLGAHAESLGVRTSILVILKELASFGAPIDFDQKEKDRIMELVARLGATHVGFYLMTSTLKPYRLLVKALREGGYRGIIMAGGVHATLCPAESLVEGADFAVQGPGERPLEMLLRGVAPSQIPGVAWRSDGGEIIINPQSPDQNLELDSLPFPLFRMNKDWVLIERRLKPLTWAVHRRFAGWEGRYYDLVTSRGCSCRCAYCCNVNGAPVRRESVDRAIREIKHVKESYPRIAGVNIQDDSFYAGSEEWVREFCRRMKEEVRLPFIIRMIPRYATEERIRFFKDAGLKYVTMGLEASTRVNRDVFNRKEDSHSFLAAARAVLDAGLLLSVDLIVDNPYEEDNDLREVALTLNQLDRPRWWIVPLSLTVFPYTPLHKRCMNDGMMHRFATDPYDSMLTPSKPGGYRTPEFWSVLITKVLPYVSPKLGARLIAMGPGDPKAAEIVRSLGRSILKMKRAASWLRDNMPLFYRLASGSLARFAPISGGCD